jgi:hypothetical protein
MNTDVAQPAEAALPRRSRRRRAAVVACAATAIVSLIGGITVVAFAGDHPTHQVALTPRNVPTSVAPPSVDAPPPSASGAEFLGGMTADTSDRTDGPAGVYVDQSEFAPSAPSGVGSLPAFQPAALPPAQDWLALLQPYVQASIDSATQAVSAEIARNVTSNVLGNTFGTAANVAFGLGDLILLAAYVNNNNGPALLTQLQSVLPAIVAPPLAAEAPILPDFGGLNAAFAAVAQMPDTLGLAGPLQLPPLPSAEQLAAALAALPPLPSTEQVTAALASLPRLPTAEQVTAAIAALPPVALPQGPTAEQIAVALAAVPQFPSLELPQLPRAEDVAGGLVGGIVAVGAVGLLLSFLQPPSLTRMMGLPF